MSFLVKPVQCFRQRLFPSSSTRGISIWRKELLDEARRRHIFTARSKPQVQQWRGQSVNAPTKKRFGFGAPGAGKARTRGRTIRTNASTEFVMEGSTFRYCVTGPGDKLMDLARNNRTTVQDLMWYHGSAYLADATTSTGLRPGTIIMIYPSRKSAPTLLNSLKERALEEAEGIEKGVVQSTVPKPVEAETDMCVTEKDVREEQPLSLEKKRLQTRRDVDKDLRNAQLLQQWQRDMEREARELIAAQKREMREEEEAVRVLEKEAKDAVGNAQREARECEARAEREVKEAESRAQREVKEAETRAKQQEAKYASARAKEKVAIEREARVRQQSAAHQEAALEKELQAKLKVAAAHRVSAQAVKTDAAPTQVPQTDLKYELKHVREVQLKQVKTLHGRSGGMGVQMRKDVLLMVGAPWCKWCDYMKPEFDRCALGLKHDNSVLILYMRGDVDREFASSLGVRSFPTVLAFRKAGGKPFVYGSTDRRVEPFLKFANYIFRNEPGAKQLEVRLPDVDSQGNALSSRTSSEDSVILKPADVMAKRSTMTSLQSRAAQIMPSIGKPLVAVGLLVTTLAVVAAVVAAVVPRIKSGIANRAPSDGDLVANQGRTDARNRTKGSTKMTYLQLREENNQNRQSLKVLEEEMRYICMVLLRLVRLQIRKFARKFTGRGFTSPFQGWLSSRQISNNSIAQQQAGASGETATTEGGSEGVDLEALILTLDIGGEDEGMGTAPKSSQRRA